MFPRRFNFALVVVGLGVGATACHDVSVDPGSELDVSLELEASTIPVGDSARAMVEAVGKDLWRLTMFWGDESADSVETFEAFGAETLSRRLAHHYPTAGTFEMRAFILEQSGDTASAVVTLQVEPAP